MGRILIVDDEPHMRRILASALSLDRHVSMEAGGLAEARAHLGAEDFDVVFTDQKMGDGEGLDVLAAVREADPTLSVVFLTAFATIELAVKSMKEGAFDFVTKPFQPEVIRAAAKRACERTTLLRENDLLRETVGRLEGSSEIFGNSVAMDKVRELIARVARTNAPVLILGETGTGKELVARAVHRNSPRSPKPFIALNCAALPPTLLESELFGHERGAFTGADRSRGGLFEAAHEGTLFLDEIGEMPLEAQAKLLRVLTDGQVVRIGSTRPRQVDVRVIAATHRDLQQRMRDGIFREDLYYRLAVVPIPVPPLRDHPEDIPTLCELFLQQASRDLKVPKHDLSSAALKYLMNYSFPGNIRELRNLIERACILAMSKQIELESFPVADSRRKLDTPDGAAPRNWVDFLPESVQLREFLSGAEKTLIERALKETGGAQAEAARRLGLSRSDLSYKLSKYGIKPSAGE
ncbi:MAG TPA: sigma-54 dependent transcriptional regulator [Candidatus Acidoferrum sp.]|nr:sigma-54 dependent transcriptional regulator [Candidatus Acidoferrum sp.]